MELKIIEYNIQHVWKACLREIVTRVRIPLSPLVSANLNGWYKIDLRENDSYLKCLPGIFLKIFKN